MLVVFWNTPQCVCVCECMYLNMSISVNVSVTVSVRISMIFSVRETALRHLENLMKPQKNKTTIL